MSKSLNAVQLIGNVGREPELKYTNTGLAVASFSLATSERYNDKDGNPQEKTAWHNLVAWGKLAEIAAEYVKKGTKLFVSGRLQYREYEKDGNKRYVTEVVLNELILLSAKQEQAQESPQENGDKDGMPF